MREKCLLKHAYSLSLLLWLCGHVSDMGVSGSHKATVLSQFMDMIFPRQSSESRGHVWKLHSFMLHLLLSCMLSTEILCVGTKLDSRVCFCSSLVHLRKFCVDTELLEKVRMSAAEHSDLATRHWFISDSCASCRFSWLFLKYSSPFFSLISLCIIDEFINPLTTACLTPSQRWEASADYNGVL